MRKKIIRYNGEKLILDKVKVARYKKLKMQMAKLMQELDPIEEQIKEDLKQYMETNGKKSLKIEGLLASFKPAYIRTMFDSKQLKEEDIKTYNKYTYEQSMGSSLTIKLDM
jgi:hypothetical protein